MCATAGNTSSVGHYRLCGVLHDDLGGERDVTGCRLLVGHGGPHEFLSNRGIEYQWETDLECDCDHCIKADGDYCTTFWRKVV